MALSTLGTNANNTLTALNWNNMSLPADVAAIAAAILGQPPAGTFQAISPGAFAKSGRLHFPGRQGFLLLKPGDYVAVDSFGWPIVVSSQSIAAAGTSWTHNP
jgi:hypothetical protein